jgi:uncharacterized membrane protein/predicted DsbA family dithiol-disulfide isomerase
MTTSYPDGGYIIDAQHELPAHATAPDRAALPKTTWVQRIALPLLIIRVVTLVALATAVFLLRDYMRPATGLCGFDLDCGQVIFSGFGRVLGVPLPLIGVAGLLTLFGLSLFPSHRLGAWLRPMALVAGCVGAGLILVQALVIRQFCPYCLVVDICAVLLAGVALASWLYAPWRLLFDHTRWWLWLPWAAVAMALPLAWALLDPRRVPEEVSAHWVPGKVTVIEIADFECPYCRRMHANLVHFLEQVGDRVHFVRVTVPMQRHRHARYAATAFLCAQEQGRGDEMAEALFAAPDLGPKACEDMAKALGLALPEFQRCTLSPAINRQLDRDNQWVQASAHRGLPVVWIQDQMLDGVQTPEALDRALQAAEVRLRQQEAR